MLSTESNASTHMAGYFEVKGRVKGHSCTDLAILISEPGPTAVPDPDRVWTAPDRHSLKQ